MNREKSCGAVVFTYGRERIIRYVLVQQRSGRFCFPKGHVEAGETEYQTAMREIWEETGIRPQILNGFCETETYEVSSKPGIIKDVVYFLAEYDGQPVDPPLTEEIQNVRLCTYEEALSLLPTDSRREILSRAEHFLNREKLSGD